MSNDLNSSGTLIMKVRAGETHELGFFEDSLPKNIQILSADLSIEKTFWMFSNSWHGTLKSGVYLVRLKVGSEQEVEKIVEIFSDKEAKVEFDLREEKEDSRILRYDQFGNKYYVALSEPYNRYIRIIDWTYKAGKLRGYPDNVYFSEFLPINSRIVAEREKIHITQLDLLEGKSIFLCLPPSYVLSINHSSKDSLNKFKISIDIPNKSAQTLLYLMNKGDSDKAESLFQVRQAEILLFEKKRDPVSAAIGGYFLLSTGQLEFMHHWPNNLANWIEWLPDGPIIHAWQMIKSKDLNIPMIKERLIEAVSRGIPLFTEGLRLLYEGLTLLYQHFNNDSFSVGQALERVKIYMQAADLSKPFTTLIGEHDLLIKISESEDLFN